MKYITLIVALLISANAYPKEPTVYTGLSTEKLVMEWKQGNHEAKALLGMYVSGIIVGGTWGDTIYRAKVVDQTPPSYCMYENISINQLTYIIMQEIQKTPERWNQPAGLVILVTLQELYPCVN